MVDNPTPPVEVTPEDREAAAVVFDRRARKAAHPATNTMERHHAKVIRAGAGDSYDAVQAAAEARHRIAHSPSRGGEVEKLREAAQFLSDRLDDLEWLENDLEATLRDFMGHVDPAHARLKFELASPPPVEIDHHQTNVMAPVEIGPATPVEGWKLVPVKPTQEMVNAGVLPLNRTHSVRDVYAAMLAASPATPAGSVREAEA